MADDKKDPVKPDKGSNRGSASSGFGKIAEDLYEKVKEFSTFGVVAGLIGLFTKDERGRDLLLNFAKLTKSGFDIGHDQIAPLVEHVKGWTKEEVHNFRSAVNKAIVTLIMTGAT